MTTVYYNADPDAVLKIASPGKTNSWVFAVSPDEQELDQLAAQYNLDRDLLVDAVDIYEAPRIEKDGNNVYVYTRYCYPEGKEIATEPLLIVITADYLITILRADTAVLDRFTSGAITMQTTTKTRFVLQIMEEINRSYNVQMKQISKRILQIRAKMRQSRLNTPEFLSIIELEEDLNEFLSALQPQALLFMAILNGKYLRLYEEDRDTIAEIERDTSELIELLRGRLRTLGNMREAYDAIATNNLNTIFKRLTSIAIFMTIPTIVSGLWGVNVPVPFQHARGAFWELIGIIVVTTALSVWYFRRKRWL